MTLEAPLPDTDIECPKCGDGMLFFNFDTTDDGTDWAQSWTIAIFVEDMRDCECVFSDEEITEISNGVAQGRDSR